MGWLQRLFGRGETGTDQAVCVTLDGAHIIDLRPLPPDPPRVLRAIATLREELARSPQPIHVWVASTRILEAFRRDTDTLMQLTDALYDASCDAQRNMIVERDAPPGMIRVLGSLGFQVLLPGTCLTAVDSAGRASEIDVLDELDALRRAPRIEL